MNARDSRDSRAGSLQGCLRYLLRTLDKKTSFIFRSGSVSNTDWTSIDLTIRLLRRRVETAQKQGRRLIVVEGFLRSFDQASAFEEKIPRLGNVNVEENLQETERYREVRNSGQLSTSFHLRRYRLMLQEAYLEEVYSSLKAIVGREIIIIILMHTNLIKENVF